MEVFLLHSVIVITNQTVSGFSDLLVEIGCNGVMFVPQEPYLTSGSLVEQVNNYSELKILLQNQKFHWKVKHVMSVILIAQLI